MRAVEVISEAYGTHGRTAAGFDLASRATRLDLVAIDVRLYHLSVTET